MADLTVFFDRCVGRQLPKLIRSASPPFVVEYHDDPKNGFHEQTEDDEWLAVVGSKKWMVVSHDKRFHKDGLAMAAVKQHKAIVFYLDGGSLTIWYKLALFARVFPKIRETVKSRRGPLIYRLTHAGRLVLVADFKGGRRQRKIAA